MAYFRCTTGGSGKGNTLVVTCADDLAGATITCTNGTKTYRKTCPSTAPYEVTFYGLEAGTWTISAAVSGTTYIITAVITDYEAELGGFNWKTWVDLSKNYTSSDFTDLDDLLNTELAVRELMSIHACVDYLADIATANEDVETIIDNDLCAKWINNRDYALDTLYANTIIADLMDEADKYFYGEWTLVSQAPDMTSATAPYGTVFAKNYANNDNLPYFAFDSRVTLHHHWTSRQYDVTDQYIGYQFVSPVHIQKVVAINYANSYLSSYIKASNDGVNYERVSDVLTFDNPGAQSSSELQKYEYDLYDDGLTYTYYALHIVSNNATDYCCCHDLKFYNWAPKGNVPVMTSDTEPYGQAIASRTQTTSYNANRAFDNNSTTYWTPTNQVPAITDYIGYKFTNPIMPKKVRIERQQYTTTQVVAFEGSNDNSAWEPIGENISLPINVQTTEATVTASKFYLYLRIRYVSQESTSIISISSLQFYGRELSVSVPKMDTNTTPYGEASANVASTNAYKAFDNDTNTIWQGTTYNDGRSDSTSQGEILYKFTSPVCIKALYVIGFFDASGYDVIKNSAIEGSNDGVTFTPIANFEDFNYGRNVVYPFFFSNSNSYLYYKYKGTWFLPSGHGVSYRPIIGDIQFYGLDYTEREFEEGTTKKWLYDHGVELETFDNQGYALQSGFTGQGFDKGTDSLYKAKLAANNNAVIFSNEKIDLTDYAYLFATNSYRSYHCAIDVSSLNTDYYLCISTHTNDDPKSFSRLIVANNKANYNTSANKVAQAQYEVDNFASPITVDEWWLE